MKTNCISVAPQFSMISTTSDVHVRTEQFLHEALMSTNVANDADELVFTLMS